MTNYCTTVKSSLSEPENTLVNHNPLGWLDCCSRRFDRRR